MNLQRGRRHWGGGARLCNRGAIEARATALVGHTVNGAEAVVAVEWHKSSVDGHAVRHSPANEVT